MPSETIRVILIDDQPLFRQGLATILEAEGLEVVGECERGEDALWLASATRPDVVLMDLRMPGLGGVEATRILHAHLPQLPVIVLTTFDEDRLVFEALRAGALGYLLKGTSSKELKRAILMTLEGSSVLTPSISRKVVSEFVRMAQLTPQDGEQRLGLSERELEVLSGLSQGLSNKAIAHALNIAEGTVKNHVSHILEKLKVSSRTEAALLAREHGIV